MGLLLTIMFWGVRGTHFLCAAFLVQSKVQTHTVLGQLGIGSACVNRLRFSLNSSPFTTPGSLQILLNTFGKTGDWRQASFRKLHGCIHNCRQLSTDPEADTGEHAQIAHTEALASKASTTMPGNHARNEFFQKLKPWCVKISQLALKESEGTAPARELNDFTNHVLIILGEQIRQDPVALDDKLAEYVFFPLYHIFRRMDHYPLALIETCIKCLTILVVHGWKSKISPELVQQILSLLTFIIDGVPDSTKKRDVPEETVLEAFRGLTALLTIAGTSAAAAEGLAESSTIPVIGHSITVMLGGVTDGATPQIQEEALRAVRAVYTTMREHGALASFLPGTLSSLARVTSTPARYKNLVLEKCLATVSLVLTRVLSDLRTRAILANVELDKEDEAEKGKILSPAWLRATVTQVKRALSTMMKLRTHDSAVVRTSLRKLCVTLLDECHRSLSPCTTLLVETAIVLEEGDNRASLTETSLQDLVSIYPELGETVKTTAYSWMTSLPRIMQAGDEDAKQSATHNLLKGLALLKSLNIESSTLEDSMSSTLRDSVVSLAHSTKPEHVSENTNVKLIDGGNSTIEHDSLQYPPVMLPYDNQKQTRNEIMSLINFLGSTSQQTRLASSMLEYVQESSSLRQIAAFWLCFQLVKASHASSKEADTYLDLSSLTEASEDMDAVSNVLYSTSVQILDGHTDSGSADWRLEAFALEVTAYTAKRSGKSFRPELIDVLFPIATVLGSKIQSLRKHAIVTLNSIAASCGYGNVSELVIDNVDYMVNSVSLRLNTLDISTASINVLTMMIRLAGPRLVPYLDDVIESIFASLENYHGYPLFVESLFGVLKEVVDQGVQSDMLLLDYQKESRKDHQKKAAETDEMQDLLDTLAKRKQRAVHEGTDPNDTLDSEAGHPQTPWKSGHGDRDGEGDDDQDTGTNAQGDEEKPPNSPTYQLLLRVANLTQYYLTSPTPTLRRSLLELLTTASVALAPDEDSFLPLVNAIWPVMIGRLHDPEPYIAVEACRAVSGLCAAAGDFLSSRFETEWHDWLRAWCRKAKMQASGLPARARPDGGLSRTTGPASEENQQILIPLHGQAGLSGNFLSLPTQEKPYSGGLGQFASPVRIWDAVVELLGSIISHVRVDERIFDDILDLLSDMLDRNKKVRGALEAINGDAVWLTRYERGSVEWLPAPHMDGVEFPAMETQFASKEGRDFGDQGTRHATSTAGLMETRMRLSGPADAAQGRFVFCDGFAGIRRDEAAGTTGRGAKRRNHYYQRCLSRRPATVIGRASGKTMPASEHVTLSPIDLGQVGKVVLESTGMADWRRLRAVVCPSHAITNLNHLLQTDSAQRGEDASTPNHCTASYSHP
ncbi:hypothetical protein G7046_g5463 [Stylonectria norvegica]|nr:hypothetical protein G7046_g5463 [Stylonectria norvegica]